MRRGRKRSPVAGEGGECRTVARCEPGEGLFAIASRQYPSPGPLATLGTTLSRSKGRGEERLPLRLYESHQNSPATGLPAAHFVILVGIAELRERFLQMVAHQRHAEQIGGCRLWCVNSLSDHNLDSTVPPGKIEGKRYIPRLPSDPT